ncbi:MAG: hypothetical protein ACI4FY_05985 [Acetatifactor sp.]
MIDIILIVGIVTAVFFCVRRELHRFRRKQFCSGCSGCSSCNRGCGKQSETKCCREQEKGD